MEHRASTIVPALVIPLLAAPALIMPWILVALACCALGIVLHLAIRNRSHSLGLEKAAEDFRALDVEAFRNLVDPEEEAFLRINLPPRSFREVKRRRAWVATVYAWEAGKAATGLARIGQAAQRSSDPKIAASGVQLAEVAFRLRFQTIGACLRLLIEILLPDLRNRSFPVFVDHYEVAAQTLSRLRGFSSGARVAADSKSA
jgi:hypothetical protein